VYDKFRYLTKSTDDGKWSVITDRIFVAFLRPEEGLLSHAAGNACVDKLRLNTKFRKMVKI
jgi:hypothetical protein